MTLGAWGAGCGAGSERPTYGSLHAKSTLCMCRPRQPTSGHPSYREPMWGDQPGGVTRDHARPQRWLRSPHTVGSPASAVPVGSCIVCRVPPGAVHPSRVPPGAEHPGRVPPGAEHSCRVPPGAEHPCLSAAWGGALFVGCRLGRSALPLTFSAVAPFLHVPPLSALYFFFL